MRTVEATASGWVLEAETASGQGAGELGSGAGVAGSESPDRSRQRIPRTPPVVRAKRHGRTAGRGFRGGGQRSPVPLFGSRAGAQAGVVHTLAPALARSVRCPFRFVALRSDEHVCQIQGLTNLVCPPLPETNPPP